MIAPDEERGSHGVEQVDDEDGEEEDETVAKKNGEDVRSSAHAPDREDLAVRS